MQPAFIVVDAVVFGVLGYFVGKRKNRVPLGIVLGVILGLIGLIIIAVIPRKND
jgi:hypothetical protein